MYIVMGYIPAPYAETELAEATPEVAFGYFMSNDLRVRVQLGARTRMEKANVGPRSIQACMNLRLPA